MKKVKRPKDSNQRAKLIVSIAVGDVEEKTQDGPVKGQAGGKKGGKARAEKLTPEQRSEIAKKASAKRWGKD